MVKDVCKHMEMSAVKTNGIEMCTEVNLIGQARQRKAVYYMAARKQQGVTGVDTAKIHHLMTSPQ